ncbi:MAG: HlyD family efflux transporter periplasmic adaptor subunit [bacterium]
MDTKEITKKTKKIRFFKTKKFLLFAIIIVFSASYYFYKSKNTQVETIQYVLGKVERGSILTSVSGSGQVVVSNQVDIKSKVSGEIIYSNIKNGQEVKSDEILFKIDDRDAQGAVKDASADLQTSKLEFEELLKPASESEILQAENSINSAKRNLEKLLNPPDALELMKAENALSQAKDNFEKLKASQKNTYQEILDQIKEAESDLEKSYEDSFNTIANSFLDLPEMITNLRDILYSEEIADSEITMGNTWNISALKNSISSYDFMQELQKYIDNSELVYKNAREKYDVNYDNYKKSSRYSNKDVIETLLSETLETTKTFSETIKSEANMFDYWVDCRSQMGQEIFSMITEYQAELKTYTSKINGHITNILSAKSAIENSKEAKANAETDRIEMEQNNPLDLLASEQSIKEKEQTLADLKAGAEYSEIEAAKESLAEKEMALKELKLGPDELEIRAKKIAVQQKEETLRKAREVLTDYSIKAPFGGVIAEVLAFKGEAVSSGTSFATIITRQKIAEITFNEIDIAKVKIGQKAVLNFTAIDGLSISGEVAELDNIGTITQGVVNYTVKIAFDTQDERIKPQMSVSATITTNQKLDTLIAPNSAVKNSNGQYYVEMIAPEDEILSESGVSSKKPLEHKLVEIGLSNDDNAEILSGLEEGEKIIIKIINNSANQTQSRQTGGLQLFGGGGNIRMMR